MPLCVIHIKTCCFGRTRKTADPIHFRLMLTERASKKMYTACLWPTSSSSSSSSSLNLFSTPALHSHHAQTLSFPTRLCRLSIKLDDVVVLESKQLAGNLFPKHQGQLKQFGRRWHNVLPLLDLVGVVSHEF